MTDNTFSPQEVQLLLNKILDQQDSISQGLLKLQSDIYEVKEGPVLEIGGSFLKDIGVPSDLHAIVSLAKNILDTLVGGSSSNSIEKVEKASDLLNHAISGSWQHSSWNDEHRKYHAGIDSTTAGNEHFSNVLQILEIISPLTQVFPQDSNALWIVFCIHRLVVELLHTTCTILTKHTRHLDEPDNRTRLLKIVFLLQPCCSSSTLGVLIRELTGLLSALLAEHKRESLRTCDVGSEKLKLFFKVEERVVKCLSKGLASSFDSYKHFSFKKKFSMMLQIAPNRPLSESIISYKSLVEASNAWRCTEDNWFLSSNYVNMLMKVAYRSAKLLSSEKDIAKQILEASILGDGRIVGINTILDKVKHCGSKEPRDTTAMAFLDGEALASLLRKVVVECSNLLAVGVENFSLDRLAAFAPFKEKYATTVKVLSKELAQDIFAMRFLLLEAQNWISTCETNILNVMNNLAAMCKTIDCLQSYLYVFGIDNFSTSQVDFKSKIAAKLLQLFPPLTGDSISCSIDDFWLRVQDLSIVQFQLSGPIEALNMISTMLMIAQVRMEDMKQSLELTVLRAASEIRDILGKLLSKLNETKHQIDDNQNVGDSHSSTSHSAHADVSIDFKSRDHLTVIDGLKLSALSPKKQDIDFAQINSIFDSLSTQVPMLHTRFSTIVNCLQEYSPILEISTQIFSKTQDMFYQMTQNVIPIDATCKENCKTNLNQNVKCAMNELRVALNENNSGWWKVLSELWPAYSTDPSSMILVREHIVGSTSRDEFIEEVALSSLLELELVCRDVYQQDFDSSDDVQDALSRIIEIISRQIAHSKATTKRAQIQSILEQKRYTNQISLGLSTHWRNIEQDVMELHREKFAGLEGIQTILEGMEDNLLSDLTGLLDSTKSLVESNTRDLISSIDSTIKSVKIVDSTAPLSSITLQKLERLQHYAKINQEKICQRIKTIDTRWGTADAAWKRYEPPLLSFNANSSKLSLATIAKLKRKFNSDKKTIAANLKEKSTLTLDSSISNVGIMSLDEVVVRDHSNSKRPMSANNSQLNGIRGTPSKKDKDRDVDAATITAVNNMSSKLDQFLNQFGKVNVLIDQLQSERLSFNPAKAFWESIKELEDRLTAVIKAKLGNLSRPSTATTQSQQVNKDGTSSNSGAIVSTNGNSNGQPPNNTSTSSLKPVSGKSNQDTFEKIEKALNTMEATFENKFNGLQGSLDEVEKQLSLSMRRELAALIKTPLTNAQSPSKQESDEYLQQIADKLFVKILEELNGHSHLMIQNMLSASATEAPAPTAPTAPTPILEHNQIPSHNIVGSKLAAKSQSMSNISTNHIIREPSVTFGTEVLNARSVDLGDQVHQNVISNPPTNLAESNSQKASSVVVNYPKPIDYSPYFVGIEQRIDALATQISGQQLLLETKLENINELIRNEIESHMEVHQSNSKITFDEQLKMLSSLMDDNRQEMIQKVEQRLEKFDSIVATVHSINQDMIKGRQGFEDRVKGFFLRIHEIHDHCIHQIQTFIQHRFSQLISNAEQQLEFILMKNYHLAYHEAIEDLRKSIIVNVEGQLEKILSTQFHKFMSLKNFKAIEELIFALDSKIPGYLEEENERNNEIFSRLMAETIVHMKVEIGKNLKNNNDIIVNEIAEVVHQSMIVASPAGNGLIATPTNNGPLYDPIYANEDALFLTKDNKRLQQLIKQIAQALATKLSHVQKQLTVKYDELLTYHKSRIEPRFDFIDHHLKQQQRLVSQKSFSYHKQQQTLAQQFKEPQQQKQGSRPTSPKPRDDGNTDSQIEPANESSFYNSILQVPVRKRPSSPTFPKADRFFKTREQEGFEAQMIDSFKRDITNPQPFSPYASKLRDTIRTTSEK